MGIESNIFDEPVVVHGVEDGYHDFNVLTTSAHSVLYRASKRGKYFIVKTTKDNSERQRQMLSREYELSKGCSHPHIVNTITLESDLAVGEGIVMEYIEGRTLQQFLDEKPSKSELNRVFGELLSAIDYIHKRGIVHNDLKPSNILITYTDNSLKLIDFGLADSDAEFVMQRLGCTSQYASPELIAREKSIDARSDIYSIGVIMSEMFGNSHIARRCMSDDPEHRYANIASLRRAYSNSNPLKWSIIGLIVVLTIIVAAVIISPKQPAATPHEVRVETRSNEERDLLAELEEGLYDIYNDISDKISQEVYAEFAATHVSQIWSRNENLMDTLIAECSDDNMKSLLINTDDRLFLNYYSDLMNQVTQLPYYCLSSIPTKEKDFYTYLIEHNLPYEPYDGE